MSGALYVTVPAGAAELAAEELAAFGAADVAVSRGGVACAGSLEVAYRACLWSRVANRVLLPVAEFDAPTPDALYAGVRTIDWSEHLSVDGTLAVDAVSQRSAITHTQFAALKVKDAVVDQFRDREGRRPSVDVAAPDVQLNLYIDRDRATLSIDLSGDSLHRRGYRGPQGAAPLKENLAAAVLLRAGWQKLAAGATAESRVGFVDPMCGSGTLAIEAALIAGDVAPGSLRERFGFSRWRGHDAALWRRLLDEAAERRAAARLEHFDLRAYDRSAAAVSAARANAAAAGLAAHVRVERSELDDLPAAPLERGLVAVNPPYGERLGALDELAPLYASLGKTLRERYAGWQAAVLTGNPPLGRELGLHAKRTHTLFNGPIECRLLRFDVEAKYFAAKREPGALPSFDEAGARARPGSAMFANRLRKNIAAGAAWARGAGVACYRVYDADMPEYAFSIDLYQSQPEKAPGPAERWVYVQEYAPPATVDAAKARARRAEAFAVIPESFGVPRERVQLRVRRRQKGGGQYEKVAERAEFHAVEEGGLHLLVNFTDYLDTGLFLDHRPTRARIRDLASGKRFLNLFAYTGTATVFAAAGGARTTTTVDLSNTYLDWARRNLELNGFRDPAKHRLLQEDVVAWFERPADERFDLVFLDPPTLSRSKRMARELDLQRDHVDLIRKAAARLAPGGVLIFSTNFRKFRLDREALSELVVEDVSAATIPKDFARDAKIHRCYEIRAPRLGLERKPGAGA
ncbi:MAG TPA: bifunctional 23S rRNA (guanine(2069)-N(7))-methyltransferase RlmK/23S rRNA (guanine(2445)-N(2))-methyltransferase RlmL [Gammaproteobacteria bacterium]|nr:bifunctional 23S rRNA (guanine(2069)-N(7))-methyltransferase RlmK/23S rRNA (guanine(2445)-N(2))-methyltransferase RlmL [Gammaproteobacteria bacterium]